MTAQRGLHGVPALRKPSFPGNINLIARMKVDTDAVVRLIQLEQKGYTLIYE